MTNKGYTLIELVVVAGILGIIGVISVGLFMSTILGGGKSSAINEVRSNGDYAITQMERVIRNARYVVNDCESDMISLEIKDPDGENTIISYIEDSQILSDGESMISTGINLVGVLDIDCEQALSKTPELISIGFTLQKGDAGTPVRDFAQVDFSTSVQLRNF